MWLENLKELKKSKGMTTQQISDATKIPVSTLKRIFAGDTDDPYISTIHKIVIALGGSLDHVLSDTNAILAPQSIVEAKENANAAEAEKDALKEKVAALTTENAVLREKNEALLYKVDALKDEIIETHRHYIKLKSN